MEKLKLPFCTVGVTLSIAFGSCPKGALTTGFDVTSVNRSTSCGSNGGSPPTPGRVSMHCAMVQTLIENAFHVFADGRSMKSTFIDISGGPSWIRSDAYDIDAKAEDHAQTAQMLGPMMQVLLEDRFKLRLHRDAREVPVYFMTVAEGGVKLQRTRDGDCTVLDIDHPFVAKPGQPQQPICGRRSTEGDAALFRIKGAGLTLQALAGDPQLARIVGRPIVDKTSWNDRFNISLEFAPGETIASASPSDLGAPALGSGLPGASLFEALQRVGLKLVAGRAPVEVLVIDHIERPSEN